MAQSARSIFRSRGVSLPGRWQTPGAQYEDAFALEEKQVPANSALNLFREPTLNHYHVDAARTIGEAFEQYLDGISAAICKAIAQWMRTTFVTGVTITGPVGQMPAGAVAGPALMPLILASAPGKTAMEARYSAAIAGAIGTAWQAWQRGLTGTLMYPAFGAFAGPLAPPTPNVPVPLMALSSCGESRLCPGALKQAMADLFADPGALHAESIFDAVAQSFNRAFQTFKKTTVVSNVLGSGPVPSFAPPLVPAGPVAAGTVIPKPGVLS